MLAGKWILKTTILKCYDLMFTFYISHCEFHNLGLDCLDPVDVIPVKNPDGTMGSSVPKAASCRVNKHRETESQWIKLLFWPKEYLNMWENQFQSKIGSLVMPLYFTATRRRRQKRTRRRPTCPSVWRMWKGLTVEASASRLISAALINLVKK